MTKKSIIYCAHCGEKNLVKDEKCTKCGKKLDAKNHLLFDYLYDHIKSKLKGKVKDNIFSLIKNYIISHLYGTSLLIAIIFSGVVTINSLQYRAHVTNITNKTEMISNNVSSDEVLLSIYTYDDYYAGFEAGTTSGYVITGDLKKAKVVKIKKNSSLNDWCVNNKDDVLCDEVIDIATIDKSLEKTAKEYKDLIKEYVKYYKDNNCDNNMKKCTKYVDYNKKMNDYMNILTGPVKDEDIINKDTKFNKNTDVFISYIGEY